MPVWEYASLTNDGPAPRETLNELGREGWELVSVLQGAKTLQLLYVFKRHVPPPMAEPSPVETSAGEAPLLADTDQPVF